MRARQRRVKDVFAMASALVAGARSEGEAARCVGRLRATFSVLLDDPDALKRYAAEFGVDERIVQDEVIGEAFQCPGFPNAEPWLAALLELWRTEKRRDEARLMAFSPFVAVPAAIVGETHIVAVIRRAWARDPACVEMWRAVVRHSEAERA